MKEWRAIPGYPRYEVSSDGQVSSSKYREVRILKPATDRGGYKFISLPKDGKGKRYSIHRLVMLAFHGESDMHVDHINGNKTDNSLGNLRYMTNSDHKSMHAQKNPSVGRGESHIKAKLTKAEVVAIRNERAAGATTVALAKKYRVSRVHCGRIAAGVLWAEVGGPRTPHRLRKKT